MYLCTLIQLLLTTMHDDAISSLFDDLYVPRSQACDQTTTGLLDSKYFNMLDFKFATFLLVPDVRFGKLEELHNTDSITIQVSHVFRLGPRTLLRLSLWQEHSIQPRKE